MALGFKKPYHKPWTWCTKKFYCCSFRSWPQWFPGPYSPQNSSFVVCVCNTERKKNKISKTLQCQPLFQSWTTIAKSMLNCIHWTFVFHVQYLLLKYSIFSKSLHYSWWCNRMPLGNQPNRAKQFGKDWEKYDIYTWGTYMLHSNCDSKYFSW